MLHRLIPSIINGIDSLNEQIGKLVSWISFALVVLICYDVIMRKLFRSTSIGIFEMEWHLFAILFLLAAGYTLKHDKHVRVDLFYSRFSVKNQAWINLIGTLIFLFPFCWVILSSGWLFARFSYLIHESSPDPGGLPARYIIKSAIMAGAGLLLLQASSLFLRSLWILLGKNPDINPPE